MRLDIYLKAEYPQFSRAYFQWLIQEGNVLVNGERVKKRREVSEDDDIQVQFVMQEALTLDPEEIPLDILYEDAHFLAINKPSGMVVHPGAGNWSGTFVNALLFYCKSLPRHDMLRPGIVHRLDKDTSGVLLAAKTVQMHQALTDLFIQRKIEKRYLALVVGKTPHERLIESPIGRHPTKRTLFCVTVEGRQAITHIRTLTSNGTLSLVDIDLKTGRTHQIRVHMQSIGHPVLGDALYGYEGMNRQMNADRQMLHASKMCFCHPLTGKEIVIEAPLPQDFATLHKKYLDDLHQK